MTLDPAMLADLLEDRLEAEPGELPDKARAVALELVRRYWRHRLEVLDGVVVLVLDWERYLEPAAAADPGPEMGGGRKSHAPRANQPPVRAARAAAKLANKST